MSTLDMFCLVTNIATKSPPSQITMILVFRCLLSITTIYALPSAVSNLRPGDSFTTTKAPHRPSTTVDSTAPIQNLVYRFPSVTSLPTLQPRQPSPFSRPLNTCNSPTVIFSYSHCTHSANIIGCLQSYLVFCRESGAEGPPRSRNSGGWPPTTPTVPRIPRPTAETGSCAEEEICVNGRVPGWGMSRAWCVGKGWFVKLAEFGAGEGGSGRLYDMGKTLDMGRMMANAVVSDWEGRTPVRVQRLEVESWVAKGVENADAAPSSSATLASLKNQTCRSCFELITPKFTPDVDLITADAAVAATGTAAGILWLAIMSV